MRFIAVHGGAGNHPNHEEKERAIKAALKRACRRGLKCIGDTLDAAVESIVVLEDDELLNAGYGSNLTMDATVECDASVMVTSNTSEDKVAFGSVGAIPGVKNPIRVARAVLENGQRPDVLGRLPPLMLVGEHARSFAKPELQISPESLICPRAKLDWEKWKERYAAACAGEQVETTGIDDVQDTVGAVVADDSGSAAGVSSGGLLLKYPGRVGEAAVYGAGCWAQGNVAISITGAGEHIIRASLARVLGEAVSNAAEEDIHDILQDTIRDKFGYMQQVGVLLLSRTGKLWCAFTTPSMAIGYASSDHPKPQAMILRQATSSINVMAIKLS